jgi:uncharacterized membrane protein YgcG
VVLLAHRVGAGAAAGGAGAGAGAGAAPGAPRFFVVLLRLEFRFAVRLDIGELRLTEGVTASRKMAMNALEGRLKKLRKAEANVDTLLHTAPGDLTSMIIGTEFKNNIAKSAAKKRKRGALGVGTGSSSSSSSSSSFSGSSSSSSSKGDLADGRD